MGDILSVFDKLKGSWREWKSTPTLFLVLLTLYIWISSNVGGTIRFKGVLFLGLFFLSVFLLYIFLCALHSHKKTVQESAGENKKSVTKQLYIAGMCISVLLIFVFIGLFVSTITDKDGKYVIWADEYQMALTHNVHKSYYLSGEEVIVHKKELDDYSADSVFYLDFKDDTTFTIAYADNLLGVVPGYNGVGYSQDHKSVLWKLVEAQDGMYYILNVEEDTYLKWFEKQQNWTTHPDVAKWNQEEYLLRLERID